MSTTLTIGYSPCPNDTFIFYGLTHGRIPVPDIAFQERLEDVETLNQLALEGSLDITKISFHALAHLRGRYAMLRSGGALGRGCGPLIVARPGTTLENLASGTIAVPGRLTTAVLLLRLFAPGLRNIVEMPFDRIMHAVSSGSISAGLIIHESRFTYPLFRLEKLVDLGEWWELRTGLPIPLGAILGRRDLGREMLLTVERAIADSIAYARRHPAEVLAYCRQHSQEMDESVMRSHIELYVNEFSSDLGSQGLAAVDRLLSEAALHGIVPPADGALLAEDL